MQGRPLPRAAQGHMSVLRDLLPVPTPNFVPGAHAARSRGVRARLRRRDHRDHLNLEIVHALNELTGQKTIDSSQQKVSAAQGRGLDHILGEVLAMAGPPCSTAAAVGELRGSHPGYHEGGGPARASFQRELVSLPKLGGLVDASSILSSEAKDLWDDWRNRITAATVDAAHVDAIHPHSDAALVQRRAAYAELLADMCGMRESLRLPRSKIFERAQDS